MSAPQVQAVLRGVAATLLVSCSAKDAPEVEPPRARDDVAVIEDVGRREEVTVPDEPVWPSPGRLVVREDVTVPTGNTASLAYDLDVTASANGYTATLSGFRDPEHEGEPRDTYVLSHQPLLRSALASGHLDLEIGSDGQLIGTPALEEVLADIAEAPAPVARVAKELLDNTVIRDATRAHAADLWIPWSGLWRAVAPLPALSGTKTVRAFGLVFVVATVGSSADEGTVTVEARTTRPALTENDLFGGRSWFVPSSPALTTPDEDTSFELVVRAELVATTLRPVAVTLSVTEHDTGRNGAPRKWSFRYRFLPTSP